MNWQVRVSNPHAGHEGYLLDQFAIEFFNKRTDEYGGTFENRYRFAAEIVKAIKEACGEDFPVSLRYSVESKMKGFCEGAKVYVVDDAELERVKSEYPVVWKNKDAKPKLCFIGCPHMSLGQMKDWTDRIEAALKDAGNKKVLVPSADNRLNNRRYGNLLCVCYGASACLYAF